MRKRESPGGERERGGGGGERETESFTVFLEENGVELERQELKMLL